MSTGDPRFDEVIARAKRGERSYPCPGHKYGIVQHLPNGDESRAPLAFNSPEEAALFIVQHLAPVLRLIAEENVELSLSIAVLLDGDEVVN